MTATRRSLDFSEGFIELPQFGWHLPYGTQGNHLEINDPNWQRFPNSSSGGPSNSHTMSWPRDPSPAPGVPDRTTSTTEGPRLGNLSVNSSAYGQPRPILYGTVRVSGQMIWSNGIREIRSVTTSQSGNNTNTDTQYMYSASFAMALAEGVVDDVIRIWANGNLIYDKTTVSGVGSVIRLAGVRFTFYPGSETQEQDPVMLAADTAIGRETPAYRGTCYLMFNQMPLANNGDGVPDIEAELVISPPTVFVENLGTTFPASTAQYDPEWFAVDWTRGFAYYANTDTQGTIVAKTSIRTGQNLLERDLLNILGDGLDALASEMITTPQGDLVVIQSATGDHTKIRVLDGNSLSLKASFGSTGGGSNFSKLGWRWPNSLSFASCYDDSDQYDFLCAVDSNFAKIGVLRFENGFNPVFLWSNDEHDTSFPTASNIHSVVGGKFQEGKAVAWVLSGPGYAPTSSDSLILHKLTIDKNAIAVTDPEPPFNETISGLTLTAVASFPPSEWKDGETALRGVGKLIYDAANDALIIPAFPDSDGGSQAFLSYNIEQNTINWNVDGLSQGIGTNLLHQSRLLDDTFGYVKNRKGVKINTVTGAVIFDDDINHWTNGLDGGAYDSNSDSHVGLFGPIGGNGPMNRAYFSRGDINSQSLETIVEDIAARANMDIADINTNDLNTVQVPGFAISNRSSARKAIEVLSNVYLFDPYESDWVLNFKMQGQNSVRDITEDDMAVQNAVNGDKFLETRKQEIELPERFTINYMDNTNNYITTAQSVKRVSFPEPAMSSGNQFEVSPPIVLTPILAKQQAEKLLYTSWIERLTYQYKFPWTFLDLDPSDVITVTFDDGRVMQNRLTSLDLGDGFTIDAFGIREQGDQFISTVEADGGQGAIRQTITNFLAARTFVLDIPLLFDFDDTTRISGLTYVFSGGYSADEFSFVRLFYSPDDTGYQNLGKQSQEAAYGSVLSVMPDPPFNNPHATDTSSTLNISMVVGADQLVSVTAEQMLNGANRALLVRFDGQVEVIHYQNVTTNSDGTYTLDTFLRGRRGTDTMTTDYDEGGSIVLLSDEVSITRIGIPLEELDDATFYKLVAEDQLFQSSRKEILVSEMRTMMPYAVAGVMAIEDGSNNIDFTWSRRSRLGGDLVNSTGFVVVHEDTEEYELDIMDGPGSKATETLTTPTFTDWNLDTVTIDGKVYTFQNTLTDVDGNVKIGTTILESLNNLVWAINKDTGLGIPGISYAQSTVVHPTVSAVVGAVNTMDITAKKYGTLANSIGLSTIISAASWGASSMNGGAEGTVVRALAGLTSPDYEYLNADIITDFGSVPALITVKVFQISAQVGRGFEKEVTIDVQ